MKYSFIIPAFNRPDEVSELLDSLLSQSGGDFEVIVVEDGSSLPCSDVVESFSGRLPLKYLAQANSGPSQARNNGAEHASGEWLVFLDSDCVLPPSYLAAVEGELSREDCDAFGGPDRAHPDFTPVQKAINYSMTSFLTTGGIRGGARRRLDRFYPRSFNMGVRRSLLQRLGGFSNMRFGEDIDLSIRLFESGANVRLFPEAWVWHKRRTDMAKFFRQVFNSGMARINLYRRHPRSLRRVHLLPALFTLGVILLVALTLIGLPFCLYSLWLLSPIALYALVVLVHASVLNGSLWVGALSVVASFIQLTGYGLGFMRAAWRRLVLRQAEDVQAFRTTFYK